MPASLVIKGGLPLRGSVAVSAAKNAALPCLAASLLTRAPLTLDRLPYLADVRTILRLLELLGAEYSLSPDRRCVIEVPNVKQHEAPYELVSTMRASVLVLGPLLAREGRARVALPGGCAIGQRPIDQHLKGFEKLGAEISIQSGYVEARASRLKGSRISLDLVTVTGTENLVMAASLAEGTTIIENAAREPEVADLARLLSAMGAKIEGAGTERIEIQGVPELGQAQHRIIPDRIEAGTLLVAGAITTGEVTVTELIPDHLSATLAKLEETGARLDIGPDWVRVSGPERPRPVDLITNPFPGFATDMQAQFMALLGLADGVSRITETIFENRFMHAAELRRMGARIETDGAVAVVRGVDHYEAAQVMASDLRASASLVLAGLAGRGATTVARVYHLDRGYERMEEKLKSLGADIKRFS
ncbi:MAG TPA: UDP-N-acetylglucosamine 1-carboxyvinyltransferase [Methylomirabilota bacterium]|nr:UDP-N-acetylglucosamine 1-carboxyvinyltransferase [Methylomirabilota bacterium]